MKIDISVIFTILVLHWIFDFILQTDKQAQGKSKSWRCLIAHTFNYSVGWVFGSLFLFGWTRPVMPLTTIQACVLAFLFALITFILHTATDYVTSRINAKLWEQKRVHAFFVSIGFDQLLHYTQLIFTYYLLKGIF